MKILLLAVSLLFTSSGGTVRVVTQGPSTGRSVALTFDAGADRGYASRILGVLERAHIHATFGMTGRWALANPDLVRRMARDDDAFMNHTYDHQSFTGLSSRLAPLTAAQRVWEVVHAETIIEHVAHRKARPYFRPPFGDYDTATLPLLRRLGYRFLVMWTVDSLGWQHLPAASIVRRCLDAAHPGAIILMHVGIQSQDAIALPTLIHDLHGRGYGFATVPSLLRGR